MVVNELPAVSASRLNFPTGRDGHARRIQDQQASGRIPSSLSVEHARGHLRCEAGIRTIGDAVGPRPE